MLKYIFFILLFTIIFLFSFDNKYTQVSIIQINWYWNKSTHSGQEIDKRKFPFTIINPLKTINGYLTKNDFPYLFHLKKEFRNSEDNYFEIPFYGNGFYSYKKIGDKITYYSKDGEVLWKKPSKSYPYSTYNDQLTLLVAGDGNQVLLIDKNGNQSGIEQADGSFLTDISQTYNKGIAVLFSGGEVYRLNSTGGLIFKKQEDDSNNFIFYKSASLSPDGAYLGLHYLKNKTDYISLYDSTGKLLNTYPLDNVYPHKIFFSVGNDGSLLLNLRDVVLVSNPKGNLIHQNQKKKSYEVYQLSSIVNNHFIYQIDNYIYFLNNKGEITKTINLGKDHYRIIPTNSQNQIFIESKQSIYQILIL
jgi:hypothetical protein